MTINIKLKIYNKRQEDMDCEFCFDESYKLDQSLII